MDRTTKQKVTEEIEDLIQKNHLELTGIYRIHYPTTTAYTFFSSAHVTFSKIDHM